MKPLRHWHDTSSQREGKVEVRRDSDQKISILLDFDLADKMPVKSREILYLSEVEREKIVIAVDPGRDKCGYAVVEVSGDGFTVSKSGIAESAHIGEVVLRLQREYPEVKTIAVGNGTASAQVVDAIKQLGIDLKIILVDEHGTSEAARALVIERTPAKGIEKFMPKGLRSPNFPYDDAVAELLGQKFLAS